MRSLSIALLTASSLVLLLVRPGGTDEIIRHSGTILKIVEKTQSIVLGEIGPWHGKTRVTSLRIVIAPDAPIVVTRRSAQAPSGFAGDFVEAPLAPWGWLQGISSPLSAATRPVGSSRTKSSLPTPRVASAALSE